MTTDDRLPGGESPGSGEMTGLRFWSVAVRTARRGIWQGGPAVIVPAPSGQRTRRLRFISLVGGYAVGSAGPVFSLGRRSTLSSSALRAYSSSSAARRSRNRASVRNSSPTSAT